LLAIDICLQEAVALDTQEVADLNKIMENQKDEDN